MPKKKRKIKLTKEERKAQKEANIIAKRLEAEEYARQLKRDRLTRELEFVHLNWRNLKRQWRETLVKIKLPEFRNEMQSAYATFERAMDLKDFTISSLLEELDDAEHQYAVNFKGHCQIIEQIMRIMGERLSDLHLWYENEFQEILVKYNLNREQMENLFGHYEMRINLASFVREKRWQEDLDDEIAEQRAKLDEHSGNMKIVRDKRQSDLEKAMLSLWSNMVEYLKAHNEKYREQSLAYEKLRKADNDSAQYILKQLRTIQEYTDKVVELKKAMSDHEARKELSVGDLQHEFNFYHESYCTLRDRFNAAVKLDDQQLKILTNESKEAEAKLLELKIKGEKILSLLAICRKHETQKEKVLPFPGVVCFEDFISEAEPNSKGVSSKTSRIKTEDDYDFQKEFEFFDWPQTSLSQFFEGEMEERWRNDEGYKLMKKLLKPWGFSRPKNFLDSGSFCRSSDESLMSNPTIPKEDSKKEKSIPKIEVTQFENVSEIEELDDVQRLNPNICDLERFWLHAGTVEISRAAVIQENRELMEFNLYLKEQLRRCLSYLPFQRDVCDPTGGYPLAIRILTSSPRDLRACLCMEYCICRTAPQ